METGTKAEIVGGMLLTGLFPLVCSSFLFSFSSLIQPRTTCQGAALLIVG